MIFKKIKSYFQKPVLPLSTLVDAKDVISYESAYMAGKMVMSFQSARVGKFQWTLMKSDEYVRDLIKAQMNAHPMFATDLIWMLSQHMVLKEDEHQEIYDDVCIKYQGTLERDDVEKPIIPKWEGIYQGVSMRDVTLKTAKKFMATLPLTEGMGKNDIEIFSNQFRYSYIAFDEKVRKGVEAGQSS